MKEYYELLDTNNYLDEIYKFLESHEPLKLTQEETEILKNTTYDYRETDW